MPLVNAAEKLQDRRNQQYSICIVDISAMTVGRLMNVGRKKGPIFHINIAAIRWGGEIDSANSEEKNKRARWAETPKNL